MSDKALIKQRFEKSFGTYDDNAVIQKITAKSLISMLNGKNFDDIFEIGSATGILTKEIRENLVFKTFTANDIVEKSEDYVKKIIPEARFLPGDIETVGTDGKFDLIISNACLQWCDDLKGTIEKLVSMLNNNGCLAITVFGKENLKEIKEVFSLDPAGVDSDNLKSFLSKYGRTDAREEIRKIEFQSLIEVLKHLKYTGVNALKRFSLTKSLLKEYEEKYEKLCGKTLTLTYNPIYVVLNKR